MREEIIIQPKKTEEPKRLHKFEIKVKNKFDEDKRNIRVCHKVKGGPDSCDILYYLNRKEHDKEQVKVWKQSPPPPLHEQTYWLGPEDSLVVEIAAVVENGEVVNNFKKDIYVETPFVADYKLFWEIGEGKERKQVDRPISHIIRDTTPPGKGEEKPVDDAKTIIVIPRDQGAWKLEIKSPRDLKEHYNPIYLLAEHFKNTGGTPDNVSIGDNGPG